MVAKIFQSSLISREVKQGGKKKKIKQWPRETNRYILFRCHTYHVISFPKSILRKYLCLKLKALNHYRETFFQNKVQAFLKSS